MKDINKNNSWINENTISNLYLTIKKKEDNIKDLINEKDIIIQEINKKIEDISINTNNRFIKIEEKINELKNENKEKDNKINEMNNKIMAQGKEIKNYKDKIELLNKQIDEIKEKYEKKSEILPVTKKIKKEPFEPFKPIINPYNEFKSISIFNYGMYEKDFFKGQKLLIVMPYSYGMNEGEDKRISYEYISKSIDNNLCFQSAIDYTGIQTDVVINYKDAILKLTSKGTYKKECCDYYACIIMSGEPYPELSNSNDDPYLFGQFIRVIKQFWKNGGGLGLFADKAPFNYQINVLIEELFPDSKFRIAGNHLGGKILYGDDTGRLYNNTTFNRKISMIDNIARPSISHCLQSIYEGTNISYFVEKPNDDDLLYFGKNEDLKMITDSKLLLPFVPFSKDSDGGFNSALFYSIDDKGDIIIDCSFSKFFLEMDKCGIPRYIQNFVSWLASAEKHEARDAVKDGTEYRPKCIDLQIDWKDKWKGFKTRPMNINSPEKMKTLFAVDCSRSISGMKIYFKKLRQLIQKYYCSSRGDKFYTWGNGYFYKTEKEMNRFIKEEVSQSSQRHSYYIAEIGRETKNENFEHLIIVTNGRVGSKDIDESDQKVFQYGLKYRFVSFCIIGNEGDESVGCPYTRNTISVTYLVDNFGNEKSITSISREDRKALESIDYINNWKTFESKYDNLFNAMRGIYLEGKENLDLMNKIKNMKSRISDAGYKQNEFNNKCSVLYQLASTKINKSTIA